MDTLATTMTATDMARNFSDVLNRVAYAKEAFVIWRGRQAVAKIEPVSHKCPLGEIGTIFRRLPKLADDADNFINDIDSLRSTNLQMHNPWES